MTFAVVPCRPGSCISGHRCAHDDAVAYGEAEPCAFSLVVKNGSNIFLRSASEIPEACIREMDLNLFLVHSRGKGDRAPLSMAFETRSASGFRNTSWICSRRPNRRKRPSMASMIWTLCCRNCFPPGWRRSGRIGQIDALEIPLAGLRKQQKPLNDAFGLLALVENDSEVLLNFLFARIAEQGDIRGWRSPRPGVHLVRHVRRQLSEFGEPLGFLDFLALVTSRNTPRTPWKCPRRHK